MSPASQRARCSAACSAAYSLCTRSISAAAAAAAAPARLSGAKRPASELDEHEEGPAAAGLLAAPTAAAAGSGSSGAGAGASAAAGREGLPLAASGGAGDGGGGSSASDSRTPAQRAFDEVQSKRLKEEARKMAAKSHSERVSELNEKLKKAPEHNDLFRISYGGQG